MSVGTGLYGTVTDDCGRCLLYTPPSTKVQSFLQRYPQRSKLPDFDERLLRPKDLVDFVRDTIESGRPLIVDDKVCSYVVWGIGAGKVRLGDPHVLEPTIRTHRSLDIKEFVRKPWMIYEPSVAHAINI